MYSGKREASNCKNTGALSVGSRLSEREMEKIKKNRWKKETERRGKITL